ncbi:uncharacterized protein TEOVI_000014000 [Trypanosoma equiperdum]|uniref:Mitochondrial carrier protein n=4 Tax=Trypanozoon TaxID=39700 RepID=Q57W58_TRYB2|nr:hypothetical protein, conserved [Trypanosoma brucei gambiense DAL972]XP_844787.1 hypothetical protein, conserved [Trypanosoma brucei brucei TREU927]AAX70161.1 hypothetical protein, conserved [Trypanosoma brucei]RHW72538.1 hypothetical protein DPX39_050017400 [Trypanosoma brucei equiperdum]SCU65058.1 hypothetical protein, conserved [Trypanosoma equiperdum]AAZ11228.1 hypothetical protein, conserved [Trypanosoma brucei brucei TREU927]CBH11019.1 hypothetical protein, conserved [Trypanosoma bru|eukprot:XP_011773306.1 hypothetical protein, conserved [Trypanosoma brucei gambiense DAL972]
MCGKDSGVEERKLQHPHRVQQFTAGVALSDIATAGVVGFTAAIPISIVDYSIMARVAGVTNSSGRVLWEGMRTLFLRPHRFFIPCAENKCAPVFGACFTVYSLTFCTSNLTKSYCEAKGYTPERSNLITGLAGGATNTLMTMWKDSLILRILPPVGGASAGSGRPKPVPWLTRGLFVGRDVFTCLAAFTITPMVATWLTNYFWNAKENAKLTQPRPLEGKTHIPLATVDLAQLITPTALQTVTTFMHIFAIRYRQTYPNFTFGDLSTSLRETYLSSLILRIVRILPAFGVGGILNRELRSDLQDRVEGPAYH